MRQASEVRLSLPSAPPGDLGAEICRVDGRPVTTAALGDFVLRYMPDRAADAVDRIVDAEVVRAEAAREAVTVSDEAVRVRVDAYVEERRRDARVQYGASTDFETLLRDRWGRDLASFRADSERAVRLLLVRDRLVRLDQFREDGVEVRVLVLGSEDAARTAAKSLRDGADMTILAERAGLRRPASPAPAARGDIPEKDLEARLFAAATGDVLDPVPFAGPDAATFWQVFKVTRAWRGSDAPWAAIAARVEDSLAASPVTEEEYRRWRRRAYARHSIETAEAAKGSVRTADGQ